jgi:Sigma-70 region 3/Sigma-70 region 2
VAWVGLVKAIDRYDPARATAFSSYPVPTMVCELKRYFRDFGWAVHVPRGMQECTVAVQATVAALAKERGRSPSAAEVAEALGLEEEQVEDLTNPRSPSASASPRCTCPASSAVRWRGSRRRPGSRSRSRRRWPPPLAVTAPAQGKLARRGVAPGTREA